MEEENKTYENGIPDGYIGVNGLTELLHKSKPTIRRMIQEGRLPKPLKDGKLLVWDKKEIDRWVKNGNFFEAALEMETGSVGMVGWTPRTDSKNGCLKADSAIYGHIFNHDSVVFILFSVFV